LIENLILEYVHQTSHRVKIDLNSLANIKARFTFPCRDEILKCLIVIIVLIDVKGIKSYSLSLLRETTSWHESLR